MLRKTVSLVLALALLLAIGITGCGGSSTEKNQATSTVAESTTETGSTEGTKAEEAGKPDFSQKVTIEMMEGGWVSQPQVEGNPYDKWIEETFNVDFKLNSTSKFDDEIAVRFASNDPPDIIGSYNKEKLMSLYEQKVLVEDWYKYMDKLPTINKTMTKEAKTVFTNNGKLALLASPPGPQLWGLKIRKDWLASLEISAPTTPEELLEMARKFTFNDPDKNGNDDTYGFTSAAAGGKEGPEGLGQIEQFQKMWGPDDFYIAADGTVKHPIIDGNKEKFLNFLRTIVKEKLINPDWYTLGSEDRKPATAKGTFGVMYYPGVIVNEIELATGSTGKSIGWYDSYPFPKGSDIGGKNTSNDTMSNTLTVSAKAESDPVKFERILAFLDQCSYPNDGFYKLRWGAEIDGFKMLDLGDGYRFINLNGTKDVSFRGPNGSVAPYDYGFFFATGQDKIYNGSADVVTEDLKANVAMDKKNATYPQYTNEAKMLNLDPTDKTNVKKVCDEFYIKYATGKETDYKAFQERWLKAGGQKLLDQATEQLKKLGLIK